MPGYYEDKMKQYGIEDIACIKGQYYVSVGRKCQLYLHMHQDSDVNINVGLLTFEQNQRDEASGRNDTVSC